MQIDLFQITKTDPNWPLLSTIQSSEDGEREVWDISGVQSRSANIADQSPELCGNNRMQTETRVDID